MSPAAGNAGVVVAAFAGTRDGVAALTPALLELRRAAVCSRLLWLGPASVSPSEDAAACVDAAAAYDVPPDASIRRLIDVLKDMTPALAVVFNERGWSPHLPAYIAYLAGIRRRVGFEAEFAGALFSERVAEPPEGTLDDRSRHLLLLRALGMTGGAAVARSAAG